MSLKDIVNNVGLEDLFEIEWRNQHEHILLQILAYELPGFYKQKPILAASCIVFERGRYSKQDVVNVLKSIKEKYTFNVVFDESRP